MRKLTKYALVAITFAVIPAAANAGADVWYVTPEDKGDCGEECRTPPMAWIDEANGTHTFGMTCSGVMVMGGSAMEVPEPPFSELEMVIDGQSLGRFSVQNGLNDVYVSPTKPDEQSPDQVRAKLESGSALSFKVAGQVPIEMTLSGSKNAIRKMRTFCEQ